MAGALRDNMNLMSKLTFRRLINMTRVWSSYQYSRVTKRPAHWGMPISIAIEPTTACNLGCPECPSGMKQFTRDTGNLKEEFFEGVIDQLAPTLNYLTFYFQGEPYINPKFLDMVSYASQKNIYTATSTNAHFLNPAVAKKTVESGLDRLIISIDGTTQEVYESYRKQGKLEKVLEGTRNIVAAKKELKSKTPHIIFQFLVVKPNEHQIEDVKKLAAEMEVDEVRFKTAQVYDFENGNELIPTIDKYARYRENSDGTWRIKSSLSNECWRMWQGCVITWDGMVVPCCFDKDASHRLGDLRNVDFKTLWEGDEYRSFRGAVLKSRNEIDICKNCTEGTKVWA
jgi:radical SAM protein with 4Fe4S-binding SPASM domain